MFRLDRIIDVRVSNAECSALGQVKVEDLIDPFTVYRESGDDLSVAIRYAPTIAAWILERYEMADTTEHGVVVNHRCRSPFWAVTRGLSYGREAVILDQRVILLSDCLQALLAPSNSAKAYDRWGGRRSNLD